VEVELEAARPARTPALVVDAGRLASNLTTMAERAAEVGVSLRPHVKTHKCVEIARRQLEVGAAGITVATVGEAETFVEAGFGDVFVAYPLHVDEDRARRLARLSGRATVSVGVDSAVGAQVMASGLGGGRAAVGVLVEVDSGHHRTGVPPTDAGALAATATRLGLDVRGVFTFPGHSYAPDRSAGAAVEEAEALRVAADSLRAHGIEPRVVSGGSTPSARHPVRGAATELRPGVYVFGDAQQLELGTMGWDAVALWAVATVVSHAGGNVVLDSGSKCLGADRAPWATGFGRLLDEPDARISQLSEHHAVVTWPEGRERPPIGSRVRVVPNHVCNAVNLAGELFVTRDGVFRETWQVAARGANS
jgi:D-serine deaminase-like pyridoxal phosphate-dependent protein